MRLRTIVILAFIAGGALSLRGAAGAQDPAPSASANDSVYTSRLFAYLRENFDDIHDVSMRFHHLDHRLNGVIRIRMHWKDGRMTSSSVTENETGNDAFARALVQRLETWRIPDLAGPFDIEVPLRIKIVGSDDPTYSAKGIFTGEVFAEDGRPVRGAEVSFRSAANPSDTLRSCFSNREGIFVKTLIPPGDWNIGCAAPGYERSALPIISFKKGDHLRERIVLRPIVHAGDNGGKR